MLLNNKTVHSDFDGHLTKELKNLEPLEKLLYLSMQIKLRFDIRKNAKKIDKKSKS